MPKLEQDINLAHALIEDKAKYVEYYSQFYKLWPFATVNMKAYLQPFNLENKNCVTIQGSSDHIFEIFLKNPKKIIGIDTNPLTEYYYYLKWAAFTVLATSEEFLKFFRWYDYPRFGKKNYEAFDKSIFQEISKYLIGDSKIFWNDLFDSYEPIQIRNGLFNLDEANDRTLYQVLNYLSKDNYEYIRKNIDKINFIFKNVDIRNLTDEITEEQDFMTLSNLNIYAHCMYSVNTLPEFQQLINILSQRLTKNGQIVAGYFYDIENENDSRDIYKKALRDKVFKEDNYSYLYFKKISDLICNLETTNHDACLVYTKNKICYNAGRGKAI